MRLYAPTPFIVGTNIELPEETRHYLLNVLRARIKDELILFNGDGGEYQATITHLSKKEVRVTINAFHEKEVESPLQIHLAQSLPRGDKLDYITQKAVELGIASMTPIIAERSQGRLAKEQEQKKVTRLQQIAIAACEQCGRNRVPVIHPPSMLANWLLSTEQHLHRFILSPKGTGISLNEPPMPLAPVFLLIGPEGGFTEDELRQANAQKLIPFRMGKRILRTETASLAAISIFQWCWGDFRG